MGHIFISYSRRDIELVNGMVTTLEQAGLSVWIDRERIKAGRTWRAQIVQAIDTCDAFVLMLSSHSAVSENVRKEIDLAQDAGRTVFILKLDSVTKVPAEMRYQLVGLQYIDLPGLGLQKAVAQLIESLKEHLAARKPDGEPAVRQVEFVIQGVNPSLFGAREQEQLLDVIAAITQTPESQLQIARLESGSVHVFMEMPGPTAFELKARALNRDRHLKQSGIKSLRIVGDRRYVNISLGILTTSAAIGAWHLLWLSFPSLFSSAFGFTGGKILFLVSVIAIVTAIGVAASKAVLPMLNPVPTLPLTRTPPLQGPLVIRDALCWLAPGSAESSPIQAGTHVGLLGRGSIPGWLIVQDPISGNPCWMEAGDLQIDPGYNVLNLAVYTPPTLALPVPVNEVSTDATPVPSLPVELPDLTTPVCGVLPCTPVPGLP
jgi:TIR domain